jgi:hypothetical protein
MFTKRPASITAPDCVHQLNHRDKCIQAELGFNLVCYNMALCAWINYGYVVRAFLCKALTT